MDDLKRRDFLKLGGARGRRGRRRRSPASGAARGDEAIQRAADRDGADRLRRHRRAGRRPRQEPAEDPRLPHHRGLRHPAGAHRLGDRSRSPRPGSRRRRSTTAARATSSGCARPKTLDLVYNATPWEWHVPIMLAAMKNGKHAATEVPAAMTLDDCWAHRRGGREAPASTACMMENCNYDRMEMMVFNMVRQGVFGEILHAEGGYLHDLRAIKFADEGEGLWRRAWATKLNGNLYPTHGLGPDRQLPRHQPRRSLRLPRLDERAVARAAGLGGRARSRPTRRSGEERYVLGDVNTSLIKTAQGRTIIVAALHQPAAALQPHPHGAGHEGPVPGLSEPRLHRRTRQARSVAGRAEPCSPSSSIRCGRRSPTQAQGAGHGGMDFIEDYRLIKCLREGHADRHERLRRGGAERGRRL